MKAFSNWRYYVICLLLTAGLIGTLAEVEDESFDLLLGSKLLGFAAFYISYRLIAYWDNRGELGEIFNDDEL